jgi:hypothetical protein
MANPGQPFAKVPFSAGAGCASPQHDMYGGLALLQLQRINLFDARIPQDHGRVVRR